MRAMTEEPSGCGRKRGDDLLDHPRAGEILLLGRRFMWAKGKHRDRRLSGREGNAGGAPAQQPLGGGPAIANGDPAAGLGFVS